MMAKPVGPGAYKSRLCQGVVRRVPLIRSKATDFTKPAVMHRTNRPDT